MEELSQIHTMLQLMPQPAFRVENGVISHVNRGAAAYFLQPGQPFAPMILCGGQEYEELSAGTLYLTLSLAEQPTGACVTRMEHGDIVTLEQAAELAQLQSMTLAAIALKEPLNGMLSLAEHFLPAIAQQDETLQTQAAQMNRRLYQLLRIVSNMTDASGYAQAQPTRMETVEICAFLKEILEKTAALAEQARVQVVYELPREAIFTMADTEKLERAVYNLLSNAIKFSPKETAVHFKLMHKNKRVHLSVSNCNPGPGPQGNIYNRFQREPMPEDPRNGIGLGMLLVRSVATLHGGAVLVEHSGDSTRITMTLQVRRSDGNQLRSPVRRIDYAGERDHCLIELADVLPPSAYSADQIN